MSSSTRKGFGITALEANACGVPVITVKHPQNAMCDLVSDGDNGLICEFSEKDISEKILLVMRDNRILKEKCLKYPQKKH